MRASHSKENGRSSAQKLFKPSNHLSLTIAAMASQFCFSATALECNVGVLVDLSLTGFFSGGGQATVDQLNDSTNFDFNAVRVGTTAITSINDLASYDALVLGGTGSFNSPFWPTEMANSIKEFVEVQGGGVVMAGWGHFNAFTGASNNEDGAEILDTFIPGNIDSDYDTTNDPRMDIDTTHPITDGLPTTITYAPSNNCCLELQNELQTGDGDISLGYYSGDSNKHTIVYREPGNGRSVYLGAIHMAGTASYPATQLAMRTGYGDQLFEQAVAWVCSAGPSGSAAPSDVPSAGPSGSAAPSDVPSAGPSGSVAPSDVPVSPTEAPVSEAPVAPTDAPVSPTEAPVSEAPVAPTDAPVSPTDAPVTLPPTAAPVVPPTPHPTPELTSKKGKKASKGKKKGKTDSPVVTPADAPTDAPVVAPTDAPVTVQPVVAPTDPPSGKKSKKMKGGMMMGRRAA